MQAPGSYASTHSVTGSAGCDLLMRLSGNFITTVLSSFSGCCLYVCMYVQYVLRRYKYVCMYVDMSMYVCIYV